jgi:RsiW-degrading membrane proteinase PrsW (M82 family)
MPTQALSERPPKVSLAVKFFYVIVGIGIIRATMTIIRHADVRSPYFLIYTKLIIYAGSLYVIYQLNKGRNWARWVLVVIFIISIPLVILPAFGSLSHNPIDALLGFIQTALYIIGLVFVFHRSSSSWFGAEKVSKKSER